MAKIIVKFKDVVRRYVTLQNEVTTIGRTSINDIPIENLVVSRRHADIIQREGGFFLHDLNSSNGTFLNGVRVAEQRLRDGDTILIGKHVLLFVEDDTLISTINAAPKSGQDPDTFLRSTMEWEIPAEDAEVQTTLHLNQPPTIDNPGSLLVRAGSLAQSRYLLHSEATIIGSATYADIRLLAPNAPSVAAVIHYRDTHYEITPSETGLLLDQRKLIQQQPLLQGSLITIQGVIFEFVAGRKE